MCRSLISVVQRSQWCETTTSTLSVKLHIHRKEGRKFFDKSRPVLLLNSNCISCNVSSMLWCRMCSPGRKLGLGHVFLALDVVRTGHILSFISDIIIVQPCSSLQDNGARQWCSCISSWVILQGKKKKIEKNHCLGTALAALLRWWLPFLDTGRSDSALTFFFPLLFS